MKTRVSRTTGFVIRGSSRGRSQYAEYCMENDCHDQKLLT